MKPYFLVLNNKIKFSLLHIKRKDFFCKGISMLSREVKINLAKTSKAVLETNIVSDGRGIIMCGDNASLKIGERVYFNDGIHISCLENVEIGQGCLFGPNVKIFDNNHQFDAVNGVKTTNKTAPIKIGKNCWIAANVVILKGTTIGENCVIGAGCVVKGDIPPASLVTQDRSLKIEPIK